MKSYQPRVKLKHVLKQCCDNQQSYFENLLFSLTRQNSRVVWLSSVDSRSTDTFGSVCFSRRYMGPVGEWWDQVTMQCSKPDLLRGHKLQLQVCWHYCNLGTFSSPPPHPYPWNHIALMVLCMLKYHEIWVHVYNIWIFEYLNNIWIFIWESVKLYWCFIMHRNHFWNWVCTGITLHKQCSEDNREIDHVNR